jgi:hypothetical protein
MSDIIYTPPASSGGTTINPNDNVIPVRLNATTFVDSNIENDVNNYLKTSVTPTSGDYFGLKIDFVNFNSFLGDFDGFSNGCCFVADNTNGFLYSLANNVQFGFFIDSTNYVALGDYNSLGSGTSFYIDQANSTIYSKHSGQQEGLFFDFVNDYFSIGDFGNTNNGTYLKIDDDNVKITTFFVGSEVGLKLDFNNIVYLFGDFNVNNNGTSLIIDDSSQKFTFNTSDLNFNGGNLQSNTASGNSGEHLVITLNGAQYKIQLLNP